MAWGWSPRGGNSDVSLNTAAKHTSSSRRQSAHAALQQRAQEGAGTATRYLRHESSSECACGCLSMCVENTNLGCTGSRSSRIPTSSSRRLPFLRLQRRHAATTLVQLVSPPRERGRTWSTVRRSPRRLQYWQV